MCQKNTGESSWGYVVFSCQWRALQMHYAQFWCPRKRMVLGKSGWIDGTHQPCFVGTQSCLVAVCGRCPHMAWLSIVTTLGVIAGDPVPDLGCAYVQAQGSPFPGSGLDWMAHISLILDYFSSSRDPEKLQKITGQLHAMQLCAQPEIPDLKLLISRLCWLTSAWHHLPPLLIPLYKALHRIPTTMVGMDHVTVQLFISALSPKLILTQGLSHKHKSFAHRGYVGEDCQYSCHYPGGSHQTSDQIQTDLGWHYWSDFTSSHTWCWCSSGTPGVVATGGFYAVLIIHVAYWTQCGCWWDIAGLGGAPFFPDGSVVWYQFQISLSEAQSHWDWVGDDMQKHIAAWELLAQYAPTFCISSHVPCHRGPVSCHQATDNSVADVASSKGLSMTRAIALVLAPYVTFVRRFQLFPSISTSPGHVNVLADSLSRFKQPLPAELDPNGQCEIKWGALEFSWIRIAQTGRKWPEPFLISCAVKKSSCSPLIVWSNRSCLGGVLTPAGPFSIVFWCFGNHLGYIHFFTDPGLLGL